MKKFAYAKINFTLEIIGKRFDGFHTIKSIFQKISLHDLIKIEVSEKPEIKFVNFESNKKTTVHKALQLFEREAGIKTCFRITVKKQIPVKSGLGGGSSDAATVLLMLNQYYGNILKKNELQKIARKIGADVPFFLNGGTALVEETGEKITRIKSEKKRFLIIVIPKFSYSTKKAYAIFDRYGKLKEKGYTKKLMDCLMKNCEDFEDFLYNDFENIYKKTDERFIRFKNRLRKITNKDFHLTGSGSAFFAIYKHKESAMTDLKALHKNGINALASKFK